jgi:hypothetical protein
MSTQVTRSNYGPEQIDKALLAYAACGANAAKACRLLKERGIGVHPKTLTQWAEGRYADRYMEIHAKHGQQLDRVLAQETRDIALRASQVERLAVDETEKELKAGTVKDASAAARNMAVVKGVATDKLLTLTGRPAQIVEHRSAQDLVKKLEALGVVDSTAEEEPDPLPEAA